MCVSAHTRVWPIVHTKQPERASGPSELESLESQAFVGFMSYYKTNEILTLALIVVQKALFYAVSGSSFQIQFYVSCSRTGARALGVCM